MSAAERISQRAARLNGRTTSDDWDPSLTGEPSELLARLQKIRARSTTTTQGSSISSASHAASGTIPTRSSTSSSSPTRTTYQPSGESGSHDAAPDELQWQDHSLTWTKGSVLMRTFSFSIPVLQAFWTLFHVSSSDTIHTAPGKMRANHNLDPPVKALCIFFEQAIHIHFPGLGEQVEMDLPFRFSQAFPAPIGFLIQRQIESEDERIASRLQQPVIRPPLQQTSSGVGYPFPDTSASSESSYSLSHMLDESELASTSQLHSDATHLLPMVFYLSRCYDDLVPVDRFPQLSFSTAPSIDPKPTTHGPPSPFGEMDEVVVFVSTENDPRWPSFIVTTSLRNSAIRVYAFAARPQAFEATPALFSTPRIQSSLGSSSAVVNGFRKPPDLPFSAIDSQEDNQLSVAGHACTLSEAPGAPGSAALGRGFPTTSLRRSARIDLDRRTSGMVSSTMGRDPSGRSRRISAMHSGAPDRRSTGRKDDQALQGRDRTLGNISHTADGLRLQSQAYPHEAMMEELAGPGTSVRIPTNSASAARLRRSSQAAARTPYGGPRNSNRASSSAVKPRPSMNLSRLDASVDPSRFTGAMPTGTIDGIRIDAMDVDDGVIDDGEVDLAHIADMDSFARSFACTCLLDEIKIPNLSSASDLSGLQVNSASFGRTDPDATYLFVSIPSLGQTLCRRLGYQRLGSGQSYRNLPFCKAPNKLHSAAVIPRAAVLPVSTLDPDSTEVVTMAPDGTFQLHFGLPSPSVPALDINAFEPLARGLQGLSKTASSIHLEAARICDRSSLRLVSTGSNERADIQLDFRPRCSTVARVLSVISQTMPIGVTAKIKSRWVEARFLSDVKKPFRYGRAAIDADWEAFWVALGLSSSLSGAKRAEVRCATAHRLFAQDPLLQDLVPLGTVYSQETNAETPRTIKTGLDRDEMASIVPALCLLAEEMRLDDSRSQSDVENVAQVCVALAHHCQAPAWSETLRCRIAVDQRTSQVAQGTIQTRGTGLDGDQPPPNLYQALLSLVTGSHATVSSLDTWIRTDFKSTELANAATTFPLLDAVIRTFAIFAQEHTNRQHLSAAIVESIIANNLHLEALRKLPFGLSLPLYQAIRCCQTDPPCGKSATFYRMIQRAELVLNASMQRSSLSSANARQIPEQLVRTLPEDVPLDAICAQLFSRDFRLRDVVAMLRTDSINSVYVAEGESQTESAITEQHNAAVAAVGERTKALPAGRAMLFMTSQRFSPMHKWRIPSICLAVRVRPRGLTIQPETKAELAGLDWPEFHNGVASVLELNLAADVKVDSKWIFAHLGEQVTARHAGFLYGLGLMKQLPSLTPVHVFRYLKMRNNLLTIGFLLGMAVSTVGTADPTARHLIGMQLTAFLPPGSAPLNLSTITQTAGLLAMGLVFLGSNHRWTAKRMLDQIGAQESPTPNLQPQHREAYSLSAGLALGLVYLGKGRGEGMKSLPDKRIVARLAHLVKGSTNVEKGLSPTDDLRSHDIGKDIAEINLTSGPAALAFGLIYLRSGNQMIADVVAPPKTPGELDLLRPDVLFAHVLARYLILWDSIEPTKGWLFSVLPAWMQKRIVDGKALSEAAQLAQINMQAGACFAIGLKYAGSKDAKACDCLWEQLNSLERQVKAQAISFFAKIRKSAIQAALDQARIALAMVLAGSGDVDLLRHLRRAHGDVDGDICYGSHMAAHMALGLLFLGGGRFTLGSSDLAVAALLTSFLPPFPRSSGDNRAHLQAFRHLWYLAIEPRLLVATDVDSDQLVSLPVKIAGTNEAHSDERTFTPLLLPNRHLSASIHSATSRYWSASIDSSSMSDRNVVAGTAPQSTARGAASATSQILFVKRKAAHLDHLADPHGTRSMSPGGLETTPMDISADATELVGPGVSELREAMRGFSAAGKQREMLRVLSMVPSTSLNGSIEHADTMASVMRAVVMECLTTDKMYVLPAYTAIVQLRHSERADSRALLERYRDVRFADEFYQHHFSRLFADGKDAGKQLALVQPALLTSLRLRAQQQAETLFKSNAAMRAAITRQLISGEDLASNTALSQSEMEDVQKVLVMSEMPSTNEVRGLIDLIRDFIRTSHSAEGSAPDGDVVRLRSEIRMVTDAAFGGASRAPWTTFILNHVVDELFIGQ